MAARKKNAAKATEQISETPEIVASTTQEEAKAEDAGSETIAIAVCLPHSVKFDDIPNGNGGYKSITLPGINSNLRGVKNAVLALPGNALCVQLPKSDWEALIAVHGRETAFVGRDGRIPCIYPVGDKEGFKDARSEIAEMRNGLEPVVPKEVGVEEKPAE